MLLFKNELETSLERKLNELHSLFFFTFSMAFNATVFCALSPSALNLPSMFEQTEINIPAEVRMYPQPTCMVKYRNFLLENG